VTAVLPAEDRPQRSQLSDGDWWYLMCVGVVGLGLILAQARVFMIGRDNPVPLILGLVCLAGWAMGNSTGRPV
jgi:hypothetical protein